MGLKRRTKRHHNNTPICFAHLSGCSTNHLGLKKCGLTNTGFNNSARTNSNKVVLFCKVVLFGKGEGEREGEGEGEGKSEGEAV